MFFMLALGCDTNHPATSDSSRPAASDKADRTNTAINARDRDSAAKSPMDQKEDSGDIKTAADIRKRVVDANMSTNANNVKIISQDGRVTLRGPVNSLQEKEKIEQIARDVAGASNVTSELEVTTK